MKFPAFILRFALAVGLAGFAPAGLSAADSLFHDPIVAKGKGLEIRKSQLDATVIALNASLAAQNQPLPQVERGKLETNILERMVVSRLVTARATPEEKDKARAGAAEFVNDVKKRMPSETAFQRRLEANGMTYAQFVERAEEEALVRLVIEREVAGKIVISDEAVKKFYDENPGQFDQLEAVRASHILLATLESGTRQPLPPDVQRQKRELITKLLQRVRAGEDFAKLAREFSEDVGSKEKGGEYTFARGRMVPEFEAAAFALQPNQISEVVTTQFGYHIIKLHEKIPPRRLAFTEVALRIKDMLLARELQTRLPEYYLKLRADAGVQITLPESK